MGKSGESGGRLFRAAAKEAHFITGPKVVTTEESALKEKWRHVVPDESGARLMGQKTSPRAPKPGRDATFLH